MGDRNIGPVLPEDFKPAASAANADSFGPALPPGFAAKAQSEVKIGPALPPGFKATDSGTSDSSDDSADEGPSGPSGSGMIGPAMPPGFLPPPPSDDSDDEPEDPSIIGPALCEAGGELSAAEDFERRAALMKSKLLKKSADRPKEREEWMTALPDKKLGASLGLTARTFRPTDGTDGGYDDSWTETPTQKLQREKDECEGKAPARKRKHEQEYIPTQRDKLMEEQTKHFNEAKNRGDSLLEMHQKKISGSSKKKKKEKDKKRKKDKKGKKDKKESKDEKREGRRPFDRELDLKVNRFDDAMRKKYIKQAQGLSGKFGHGQTKYI